MRRDVDTDYRVGLQDETQNHNRTLIGQITSVDNRQGLITVRTVNGQQFEMPIPLLGFSPQTQLDADGNPVGGFRSSWIRYMPQNFDFVKVAFGPDRRPECVGMACWGDLENSPGPIGQLGGYADVVRAREEGIPGFAEFRDLRQGEWDMRSRGNAYIYGSATGVLFLAGGGAKLVLNKEDDASRLRATNQRYESTENYILRTGPLEDDDRIVEEAQNEGTTVHARTIDAQGNATHTGDGDLTLNHANLHVNHGNAAHTGSGDLNTDYSTQVHTAGNIKLGSSGASEPFVQGNALASAVSSLVSTLNSALPLVADGLEKLEVKPTPPGQPIPNEAFVQIALLQVRQIIPNALSSFQSGVQSSLSGKIQGE